jgi:inward rectifier potassium channel
MSPESLFAHLLVSLEALFGLLGLATVTGLVFAKFSRPTARVRFSRYAIVAPRDGVPCLQFRAANYRANRIVEATMHVVLTREETTVEGATFRRFHDLSLIRDRNPTFSLSWTVLHPIDERSPLFGQTSESLAASRAEVIVSMTGLDETFSQTIHARHFYEPHEIHWNHQFVDIFERQGDNRLRIDYSKFDAVVEIEVTDRLRVVGQ